jgi:hypothetical protein
MVAWVPGFLMQSSLRKPRQTFTSLEDKVLSDLVRVFGENEWGAIAAQMPGRTPRQCRDRWRGYLAPTLTTEEWTPGEDRLLLAEYDKVGPRWSLISHVLKRRSEVAVKNRGKLLNRRSRGAIFEWAPDGHPMTGSLPMPACVADQPANQRALEAFFSSLPCGDIARGPRKS